MPGMSHTPSGQKVATTSSVRPSSSACVYAAIAARTPSTTSAYVMVSATAESPDSEADVDDGVIQRVHVDRVERAEQLLVGQPGEVAVDRALEVRDVSFDPLGQAH